MWIPVSPMPPFLDWNGNYYKGNTAKGLEKLEMNELIITNKPLHKHFLFMLPKMLTTLFQDMHTQLSFAHATPEMQGRIARLSLVPKIPEELPKLPNTRHTESCPTFPSKLTLREAISPTYCPPGRAEGCYHRARCRSRLLHPHRPNWFGRPQSTQRNWTVEESHYPKTSADCIVHCGRAQTQGRRTHGRNGG